MKRRTANVKERYNWPVTILLIAGIVPYLLRETFYFLNGIHLSYPVSSFNLRTAA